jgi:hypothetical protein
MAVQTTSPESLGFPALTDVGTDLKAEGNEVAEETLEIAHEGFTVANG